MKRWVQILLVYLIGVAFILLMAWNAKNYDNRQNKTQNYSIGQLH